MDSAKSVDVLTSYKTVDETAVDKLLAHEIVQSKRKIVVLDDDPTGTQTVHGISVFTNWKKSTIEHAFAEDNALFYLLTNSRSFTKKETVKAHREIATVVDEVSKEVGKDYIFVSRSDSTLRGHYPIETEVLCKEWESNNGKKIDGEIICPFFKEGGRFTIDDVHYVQLGNALVPASETEFAQDKTFGHSSSNLKEYVEEKTCNAYKSTDVISISLSDLRNLAFDSIEEQLLEVENFNKVIVNAIDYIDLKVFLCGTL